MKKTKVEEVAVLAARNYPPDRCGHVQLRPFFTASEKKKQKNKKTLLSDGSINHFFIRRWRGARVRNARPARPRGGSRPVIIFRVGGNWCISMQPGEIPVAPEATTLDPVASRRQAESPQVDNCHGDRSNLSECVCVCVCVRARAQAGE